MACRLVDAKGQPRPDVELESGRASDPLDLFVAEPIKTDRDSRFRIDGLVSGRKYHFNIRVYDPAAAGTVIEGQAISGLSVKAGETRDLGDVRSKRFR